MSREESQVKSELKKIPRLSTHGFYFLTRTKVSDKQEETTPRHNVRQAVEENDGSFCMYSRSMGTLYWDVDLEKGPVQTHVGITSCCMLCYMTICSSVGYIYRYTVSIYRYLYICISYTGS